MNLTDRTNALVRKHTAFRDLADMLNTHADYRPTLRTETSPELVELADAYDAAQAARGDERRAFRG